MAMPPARKGPRRIPTATRIEGFLPEGPPGTKHQFTNFSKRRRRTGFQVAVWGLATLMLASAFFALTVAMAFRAVKEVSQEDSGSHSADQSSSLIIDGGSSGLPPQPVVVPMVQPKPQNAPQPNLTEPAVVLRPAIPEPASKKLPLVPNKAPAIAPVPFERSEPPSTPIVLPNGREVAVSLLDLPAQEVTKVRNEAKMLIEQDEPFSPYVEHFENGQLATCQAYDGKGLLDRGGMTLYRDGRPMILANYKNGRLDGQVRIWEKTGSLLLYAEYTRDKPNGLVCLFNGGRPWLVLDLKPRGTGDEFLVGWIGSVLTIFDLSEPNLPGEAIAHEAAARAELEALQEMLAEMHKNRRPAVRQWFEQERAEFQKPLVAGRARAFRIAQINRNREKAARNNAAAANLIGEATKKRLPW